MLRREVTSQLWMASHILSMTESLVGSSMDQESGPSNMMWDSTPHALYDTSMPSALLSNRSLPETQRHDDDKTVLGWGVTGGVATEHTCHPVFVYSYIVVAVGNTLLCSVREFFPSKVNLCFVNFLSNVFWVGRLHNRKAKLLVEHSFSHFPAK